MAVSRLSIGKFLELVSESLIVWISLSFAVYKQTGNVVAVSEWPSNSRWNTSFPMAYNEQISRSVRNGSK